VKVLRPDQKPLAGIYSREAGSTQYLEDAPEEIAVRKALAHALLPLELYQKKAYGLPDPGR